MEYQCIKREKRKESFFKVGRKVLITQGNVTWQSQMKTGLYLKSVFHIQLVLLLLNRTFYYFVIASKTTEDLKVSGKTKSLLQLSGKLEFLKKRQEEFRRLNLGI